MRPYSRYSIAPEFMDQLCRKRTTAVQNSNTVDPDQIAYTPQITSRPNLTGDIEAGCSRIPDIPPSVDKRGYSASREQAMADFKIDVTNHAGVVLGQRG
jgi:hypothetical protein